MRYFLGPIIIVLAVLLMKYTVEITNFTGKLDWAERYLSTPFAGTYSWWRIVGLLLIIFSLAWMFGLLNGLLAPGV
jgi:cellobiose-specific phosphotransferase system component IIC